MDNLFQSTSSISLYGNISFVRKTADLVDSRITPSNTALQITQETMIYCQACRRSGVIPMLNTGTYEVCIDCLCKYVIQQAPKREWRLEDYIIYHGCNIIPIYYNNTYYLLLSRDLTIRYTVDINENLQRIINVPREINSINDIDWHIYGNANDIARYLIYFKHYISGYARSHYIYVENYDITGIYNHKTVCESKYKNKRLITVEEFDNARQFHDAVLSLYDFNANVDSLYIKLFGRQDIEKIEHHIWRQKEKIFKTGRHYGLYIGISGIDMMIDPSIRRNTTIIPSTSASSSSSSASSSSSSSSSSMVPSALSMMDEDSHYDLYETSLDNSLLD